MKNNFNHFKEQFLETLDDTIREDLRLFDIIDDEHYDFEFDRIKDARLKDFTLNSFSYYQDWLDARNPEYSYS